MNIENINQPSAYFKALGGLHDSRICKLLWDDEARILSISIDDLHANFLDLPEYDGLQPILIKFVDVSSVDIDTQVYENALSIYELEARDIDSFFDVEIKCSPGGLIKCKCKGIQLVKEEI